jgi:hypothetical protein
LKRSRVVEDVRFYQKDEEIVALLQDVIDANSRSHRKDRFALMLEPEPPRSLLSTLNAEVLSPDVDYHWSGIQRRGEKPRKRTLVGDYYDWCCWFLRTQRFRAFHTIVVVDPVGSLIAYGCKGYLDGVLARLRAKPIRFVVLESMEYRQVVDDWLGGARVKDPRVADAFGRHDSMQAVLALLYGTRLQIGSLRNALSKTLWASANGGLEAAEKATSSMRGFVEKSYHRDTHLRLSERGRKFAEGMVEEVVMPLEPDDEPDIKRVFRGRSRGPRPVLPDSWLRSEVLEFIEERGWMTVPMLAKVLYERHCTLRRDEDSRFMKLLDDHPYLSLEENERLIAPSRHKVRQLLAKLQDEGTIASRKWYREVGRPAKAYFPMGQSPLDAEGRRCGQCAFHISLRRQCRLWWLLARSFGFSDPRWTSDGERPLSPLEIHKMKNASRIGPHSSACKRFVDKKRDYSLKGLPLVCDLCGWPLSTTAGKLVECANCRTRYFKTKKRVRVLTAYEDRFQSTYFELAGRKASEDLTRLREQQAGSGFGALEEIRFQEQRLAEAEPHSATLMLFPGDKMLVREGRISFLGSRKVETVQLANTVIVDHGVLEDEQIAELTDGGATVRSVVKRMESDAPVEVRYDLGSMAKRLASSHPNIGRTFAVAMAKSAIHATEHIVVMALSESDMSATVAELSRLLRRLERSPPNSFLTYEAIIMKRYWSLYDMALKANLQRFGPRKRSRFVREHVTSPTGRARGYTAVDSAINYLHQRRLFKVRQTNRQLGIVARGEGFLHRKAWNAEGLGLILDLVDPLKFGDREKLLEGVLDYRVNWRDFHTATDRQGTTFYYPKSEAVPVLEKLGDDADTMQVEREGKNVPLMEAYKQSVLSLVESLNTNRASFLPFVF